MSEVIMRMAVAGYTYDSVNSADECLQFFGKGNRLYFGTWKEARDWVANVFSD